MDDLGLDEETYRKLIEESERAEKEAQQARRKVVIEELQGLVGDSVDLDVVVRVLMENEWDGNRAILPLLKIKEEKEKEVRLNAAKEKMMAIFADAKITEEEIFAIIEEKDGVIEEAAEVLASLIAKREAATSKSREEEEKQRRETIVANLLDRFDNLNEAEVSDVLARFGWAADEATMDLVQLSRRKSVEALVKAFPSLSETEIIEAVLNADGQRDVAAAQLHKLKAKKDLDAFRERETKAAAPVSELPKIEEEHPKKPEEEEEEVADQDRVDDIVGVDPSAMLSTIMEDERTVAVVRKVRAAIKDKPHLVDEIARAVGIMRNENMMRGAKAVSPEDPPVEDEREKTAVPLDPPAQAENAGTQGVVPKEEEEGGEDQVKLTVTPRHVDIGQPITVSWEVLDKTEVSNWDWIGMYKVGRKHTEYIKFKYNSSASRSGSLTFTSVGIGEYMFRYCRTSGLVSRTYKVLGKSDIACKSAPVFEMKVEKSGETFEVRCKQTYGNAYKNAWVGLYDGGKPNRCYTTYQKLSAAVAGKLTFDIPRAAVWEFRLFPEQYDCVARVQIEQVGTDSLILESDPDTNEVVVKCTVNTLDCLRDGPWVGIYNVEQQNNTYYRRAKVISEKRCELRFRKLKTHGTYEARLLNKDYRSVCISEQKLVVRE